MLIHAYSCAVCGEADRWTPIPPEAMATDPNGECCGEPLTHFGSYDPQYSNGEHIAEGREETPHQLQLLAM